MPDPLLAPTVSAPLVLIAACEFVLWFIGIRCLVRALRHRPADGPRLAPWTITLPAFLQSVICVGAGGYLAQVVVANLSNNVLGEAAHDGDLWTILLGTAFQLGMLLGIVLAIQLWRFPGTHTLPLEFEVKEPLPATTLAGLPHRGSTIAAGLGVFAIALPVITLVGLAWKTVLEACGLPTDQQELVGLFVHADSSFRLVAMILLAIVVAPLTEELIFRAGLFRYLRTRVPRWLAFGLPAVVFASLHINWRTGEGLNTLLPLTVLAVLFSLAYERTGRIAVPIIAHSLFNLHTILLLLAGVTF